MKKIKFVDFKKELSDKLNSKINNYCFYAFDQKQFDKGLEEIKQKIDMSKYNGTNKFNVLPTRTGAYIVADKLQDYKNAFISYNNELAEALKNNYELLVDAINYEMGNHEYGYTMDDSIVLESLGYSIKTREKNETLKKAWLEARKQYMEYNKDNF